MLSTSTRRLRISYTHDTKSTRTTRNSVLLNFTINDYDAPALVGSTAILLLYMRDGSFYQIANENLTLTDNVYSYTLSENQGKHDGIAQAQLIVTIGTAELATQKFEFEIVSGLDQAVAVEVMIQDWSTLTAEARAFLDQAELDEDQRIANEEARVLAESQRINDFSSKADKTYVDEQDEEIRTQLADKANKVQEDWITPTLLNRWEHVPENPIQYCKDNFGYVHIRGRGIPLNSLSGNVFTLPPGYRPTSSIVTPSVTGATSALGIAYVAPTGNVGVAGTINKALAYYCFDMIPY